MDMYCRQCEQTAKSGSCSTHGVCGKNPEVSALQDLVTYSLQGLTVYALKARDIGFSLAETDKLMVEGLFSAVTNVNFDEERLAAIIYKINDEKKKLREILEKKKAIDSIDKRLLAIAAWEPGDTLDLLIEESEGKGKSAIADTDEDLRSLKELILYGLRGMAAYADHALVLGKVDKEVMSFFYTGFQALMDPDATVDALVATAMALGKANLKCMELLDSAHTAAFGHPVPTQVALGVKKGPAIIVSGHDLYDLQQLLEQTQGTGVNVYTHGEMLPAHGYPGLNKYKHLAGHFGTAWQNQQKEFDGIPAVILMTTNCIQRPLHTYKDRIVTTGLVAWPEVEHIPAAANGKKDFSRIIQKARELGGFSEDAVKKNILVGFAHHTVLSLADKIVEAVKGKKIRHFFLIGGCDGARPGRNYYTEFAQKVPNDCIILTLACGKFRFNDLEFGSIGEFPRLLDVGQCNDAYSAIKIASALAEAFQCGVNDLPLSLVLSWYEQKAVVILLSLLSLGIKGIRLGPTLPAFVSGNVLGVLVKNFDLKPITTPDKDLEDILGTKEPVRA